MTKTAKFDIDTNYGNTGCWVQNWKYFCLKINTAKGNDWILRIGVLGRCQKLGIILELNEVIKKLILSKNVNKRKCAPKCRFWGKNLSNFVPPAWKLDYLYYHSTASLHSCWKMYYWIWNFINIFIFKNCRWLESDFLFLLSYVPLKADAEVCGQWKNGESPCLTSKE